MPELTSCPFCGADVTAAHYHESGLKRYFECPHCGKRSRMIPYLERKIRWKVLFWLLLPTWILGLMILERKIQFFSGDILLLYFMLFIILIPTGLICGIACVIYGLITGDLGKMSFLAWVLGLGQIAFIVYLAYFVISAVNGFNLMHFQR